MYYGEMMRNMLTKARTASRALSLATTDKKNKVLLDMARSIEEASLDIIMANKADIKTASSTGRSPAYLDRLRLDEKRIFGISRMLRDVAALNDPIGTILEKTTRPNGLVIEKIRVPIGVIGIIYESRPNVTADSVALCFKSSNVAVLRGGSDAINSNMAIYEAMKKAALDNGMHEGTFILIEDKARELVDEMLASAGYIDLIMPRGGESLINEVSAKSKVPVIKHYKGVCHVYVDEYADLKMAENICLNAKVERPGVCNAMETMIVNDKIADKFLPAIHEKMEKAGVLFKGCDKTRKILSGKNIKEALDSDYHTEYLDLILNVKVVGSVDEAINHISSFGTNHSDAIVTENKENADRFTSLVDSSSVYVNASTRFTDGGEFGKGAEIGISTDKLHARGPMGVEELTTYKYVIHGTGQVR